MRPAPGVPSSQSSLMTSGGISVDGDLMRRLSQRCVPRKNFSEPPRQESFASSIERSPSDEGQRQAEPQGESARRSQERSPSQGESSRSERSRRRLRRDIFHLPDVATRRRGRLDARGDSLEPYQPAFVDQRGNRVARRAHRVASEESCDSDPNNSSRSRRERHEARARDRQRRQYQSPLARRSRRRSEALVEAHRGDEGAKLVACAHDADLVESDVSPGSEQGAREQRRQGADRRPECSVSQGQSADNSSTGTIRFFAELRGRPEIQPRRFAASRSLGRRRPRHLRSGRFLLTLVLGH